VLCSLVFSPSAGLLVCQETASTYSDFLFSLQNITKVLFMLFLNIKYYQISVGTLGLFDYAVSGSTRCMVVTGTAVTATTAVPPLCICWCLFSVL
jgi:hypothetical protein